METCQTSQPLTQTSIVLPEKCVLFQSDGSGGVYFHDKEFNDIFQFLPNHQNPLKLKHQFDNAILFAITSKAQAFVSPKNKNWIQVKSETKGSSVVIKTNDDPVLIHFLSDKNLLVVGSCSVSIYSTVTQQKIDTLQTQRPWKCVHYKNIVVMLLIEKNALQGNIVRCSETVSQFAQIEIPHPENTPIFPNVSIITIFDVPYLSVDFSNAKVFLFDLSNPTSLAKVYEAPVGDVRVLCVNNVLVIANKEVSYCYSLYSNYRINSLANEKSVSNTPTPVMAINFNIEKPNSILRFGINITPTLFVTNNICVDPFLKKFETLKFDFKLLEQMLQFYDDELVSATAKKFTLFYRNYEDAICEDVLVTCGAAKCPLWDVGIMLSEVVCNPHTTFPLIRAIRALTRNANDPSYTVCVYIESARAAAQSDEGSLDKLVQSDLAKELNKLERYDVLRDFLRHHIITDNTQVAFTLTNSTNETIQGYGYDMLKRLGDFKALIDCLLCKGKIVDALRLAKQKNITIDKEVIWQALACFKSDPIQYQLQWFFLDNK
ncbi:hypothetical protein EIN_179660 [Entamoeba invadens IP1]|uniref:hypothetical protein n=1 Tax=Entamoeba invadens IP1 TaxID=370355 RepID=UPI0002C3E8EB|nr:hypothetical protein EIN_179660 [Entamoeba invadens IP1]ELP93939.1 hypothetical protein EIN_179660 [Entamoeba invadens IP1]|eukprot:XP_004260710.1 hypothetical protein EIN_179660 [Entamoeba invadens IP1]